MLGQVMGAQFLEGAMLVCFGVSWPVAILKTLRTRRTEGKSRTFLVLVLLGYLAGVASKFLRASGHWPSLEPVTALYALNAVLVAADLALVIHFRLRAANDPDWP